MDFTKEIREIIVEKFGITDSELSNDAKLSQDLGGDSLDVVEIIMEIESKCNVRVDDMFIREDRTVREVINYVNKLANEEG